MDIWELIILCLTAVALSLAQATALTQGPPPPGNRAGVKTSAAPAGAE